MGIGIDRLCMLLTGNVSIQDVLLFPQMKPEKQEVIDSDEKFVSLGIPEEWVEVIKDAGFKTIAELKAVENPNKLHQQISGINKKKKLGLTKVSPDDVNKWIS